MAADPKQILGAVLTFTMFVMLGSMIKRDHFDSAEVTSSETSSVPFDEMKVEEKDMNSMSKVTKGPWKDDTQTLKPCWTRPKAKESEMSRGFITFSLSSGPEYHISQVSNAVVIAKYLGATLVLPDMESKQGEKRNFQEIYDIEKFVRSLDGIVNVLQEQPADIAARKPVTLRIPYRVTEAYIAEYLEPVFKMEGSLRVVTYFPSANMKRRETLNKEIDSVACLAMFGTLELQPEIQEVVDTMIERLRTLSRRSDGRFIAVDLRVDILEKKGCKEGEHSGMKGCFNPQVVGAFLKKIGFDSDTTIYLTQSRWNDDLKALKDIFPKSYTKEGILPADKKKFLDMGSYELEKTLDFYISSQSDVFVPAISGLFYSNVAGKRIASGRNQILVPAHISGSSASAADYVSRYISDKSHLAYSCFC